MKTVMARGVQGAGRTGTIKAMSFRPRVKVRI